MATWIRPQILLNAKQAVGVGTTLAVSDIKTLTFWVATSGMGAGDTIKIYIAGSLADEEPDFSATKSASNVWDYVGVKDLNTFGMIPGDSGIEFSEADDVRQLEINIDGLRYVTAIVDTITDATTSVTVKLAAFSNFV